MTKYRQVIDQVDFELRQIEQLLESYEAVRAKAVRVTPDLVERTALASVLHSFYNGLENIFLRIAKGLSGEPPVGERWHRDLLASMGRPADERDAVLTPDLVQQLAEYLSFRHFYRHSYSFFLDWREMGPLVETLSEVWPEARRQLLAFLSTLRC